MNLKNIIYTLLTVLIIGCQDDNSTNLGDFNYQRQYNSEKLIIEEFLDTHSIDLENEQFKVLEAGEIALVDDVKLKAIEQVFNGVTYTAYTYPLGGGNDDGISPDDNDIASYVVTTFDLENKIVSPELSQEGVIRGLDDEAPGVVVGLKELKPGISKEEDFTMPREYINPGKVLILTPTGLLFFISNQPLENRPFLNPIINRLELRHVVPVANK